MIRTAQDAPELEMMRCLRPRLRRARGNRAVVQPRRGPWGNRKYRPYESAVHRPSVVGRAGGGCDSGSLLDSALGYAVPIIRSEEWRERKWPTSRAVAGGPAGRR